MVHVQVVDGSGETAPIDGDLPYLAVVYLPQAGKQYRIHGGLAGMVRVVGGEGDHSVHHGPPVHECASGKQELAEIVRMLVHGQRGLGIQREGLFVRLEGCLVFVAVVETAADGGSEASVYDGELPILLVVYLLSADEHRRSSGEGAYLELLLVLESGEIIAEREQGGGIGRGLIISSEAVREGFGLELG